MELERAAETLLAAPSVVGADERRAAEAVFTELKAKLGLEEANQIMQSSQHPFVLHQIGQAVGEIVLRDWALLEQAQVEAAYRMLVEFVASRDILPVYVVAEFLRSAAMIMKRGTLDGKAGNAEEQYEMIRGLLSHPEARMQAIGVQLISSICEQFASSWRNSKFSITWDFHLAAKSEFEKTGLRKLLEMAVTTLHALGSQKESLAAMNDFERRLCEKFLEVAESAFSWNFSARLFRRLFSMHQTSTSFRPPKSWTDLLSNDEFFLLFFKLHDKVRPDPSLSLRSLSCLVQLASLSGEVMTNATFAQHYVSLYVENMLNLFPAGPQPHELDHFCTLINRLFMYRPIQSLMRMAPDLRTRFFAYVAQYMQHLTGAALQEAIGASSHATHASLALLYDAWNILLRGKWKAALDDEEIGPVESELVREPTLAVIRSFFNATQSAPFGARPRPVLAVDDDEDEEDEEMNDDRKLYADLLTPLGGMACFCAPTFMDMMTSTIRERLAEFSCMADGSGDATRLPDWKEDMHWLMLVAGFSLVGEDNDGSCHVHTEVFDHSILLCSQQGGPFATESRDAFLRQCIEHPTAAREGSAGHVDPFLILVGELFAWSSLEQQLMTSVASLEMISPELSRSTCLALKRILNATSNPPDEEDKESYCYPLLPTTGPVGDLIVEFVLTKTFTILDKFSGERKLCADAVSVLNSLVESRAPSLAASPTLFGQLSTLDIAKCPVRAELMRVLVLIGAAANDDELRQNMFTQILQPLATRYAGVLQEHQAAVASTAYDSDLIDLLQCFDGVAKASQPQSAAILFKVVEPVLDTCPSLVRSASAPVVTSVLTLIQDVTTKISVYIDDKEISMKLYTCLLSTVEGYRATHGQRFVGMTSDDEEKAADLVLFMDILSNILSNDILESVDDRQLTGSQVAISSLEMLLCVMSEALLQHPEVAIKFYRLLLYLTEFCPESLAYVNEQLLNSMCECLKAGLSSKFGSEIASVCLESLAEVAAYFINNRDKCTANLVEHFHAMMPMAFEACLENSAEASLFSEACSCLYSLICFDFPFFNSFVEQLLSRKSNQQAASVLARAFGQLFPEDPKIGRRERIAFRQRMEKFLGEIQGLLWLS